MVRCKRHRPYSIWFLYSVPKIGLRRDYVRCVLGTLLSFIFFVCAFVEGLLRYYIRGDELMFVMFWDISAV